MLLVLTVRLSQSHDCLKTPWAIKRIVTVSSKSPIGASRRLSTYEFTASHSHGCLRCCGVSRNQESVLCIHQVSQQTSDIYVQPEPSILQCGPSKVTGGSVAYPELDVTTPTTGRAHAQCSYLWALCPFPWLVPRPKVITYRTHDHNNNKHSLVEN